MMRSLLNTPCNNWLDEVVAGASALPVTCKRSSTRSLDQAQPEGRQKT